MPRFEYRCTYCPGVTVIMTHPNIMTIDPPPECSNCGEDFLRLSRYDRDVEAQLLSLQEDITSLRMRFEDMSQDPDIDDRDFTRYN